MNIEKARLTISAVSRRLEAFAGVRAVHLGDFVVLLLLVFYLATMNGGHDWGDDFAMYILHAQNMVEGRPYTQTPYLHNPDFPELGPRAYPPGFPALLAPFIAVFGLNLLALKLVGVLSAAGILFFANHRLIPPSLAPSLRVLLLLVAGLHPAIYLAVSEILSDLPFGLACMLALWQIQRITEGPPLRREKIPATITAGVLIFAAFSIRSAGIILLPLPLLADLFKHRRLRWQTVAATTLSLALMTMQVLLLPAISSYFDNLPRSMASWAQVILHSLRYYLEIFRSVYTFENRAAEWLIFAITAGLALSALWRRVRKGFSVYDLFFLAYLAFLMVWPIYQGLRLALPVLFLYQLYAFEGFQAASKWALKVPQVGLAALIILTGLYYAPYYAHQFSQPQDTAITAPDASTLFAFVREQTGPEDVVGFYKPRALALFTGRSAFAPSGFAPEVLLTQIERFGATFLIEDIQHPSQAVDMEQAYPNRFQVVFQNDTFRVYRVNPP